MKAIQQSMIWLRRKRGAGCWLPACLRAAFDRAQLRQGAWLSFEDYCRGIQAVLERRLRRGGLEIDEAGMRQVLSVTRLDDLHIALGCEAGSSDATSYLMRTLLPTLRADLLREGSPQEIDDLLQDLPSRLFSPPGTEGVRTALGTYLGSGSLRVWLAIIARRRLVDFRRSRVPSPERLDDEALASREGDDPLHRLTLAEWGPRWESCLQKAWGDLNGSERLALLYKYRDGLTQRQIAAVLGIGESKLSRQIHRNVEALRREAKSMDLPFRDSGYREVGENVVRYFLEKTVQTGTVRSDSIPTGDES